MMKVLLFCALLVLVFGDSLVGLYTLDEEKGNLAWDSSPIKNHALFLDAIKQGGWDPHGGKINGAYDFTGRTVLGFIENLAIADFSIAFWIFPTKPGPDGRGSQGSQWYYGNGLVDGEIAGRTADFGTSFVNSSVAFGVGPADVTLFAPVPLNEWTFVTAVRQVTGNKQYNNLYIYINGVKIVSGQTINGTNTEDRSTTSMTFGALQTRNNFFEGKLDEIRIYDYAISDTTIADIYNSEKNGKEPATIEHEPGDPDAKSKGAATAFAVIFAIISVVEGLLLAGLVYALKKKKNIPYLPVNNRLLDDHD